MKILGSDLVFMALPTPFFIHGARSPVEYFFCVRYLSQLPPKWLTFYVRTINVYIYYACVIIFNATTRTQLFFIIFVTISLQCSLAECNKTRTKSKQAGINESRTSFSFQFYVVSFFSFVFNFIAMPYIQINATT